MNESKKIYYKKLFSDVLFLVTAIFPFALSMGVCSGIGATNGIIAGILCSFVISINRSRAIMPIFTAFSVITYLFNAYGTSTLSVSILTAIILISVISAFKIYPRFEPNPAIAGVMLSTAFTITAIHTNQYFGIGAIGNTVTDIIKSYVSFGFHGNWRGVFYGTVVMVIMITFHRKFKNLDKTIRSAFVAVIISLILNLFLNPTYMKTAINEIGDISLSEKYSPVIFKITDSPAVLIGILGGMALFFVAYYSICSDDKTSRQDMISCAAVNTCCLMLPSCIFIPAKLKSIKESSTSGVLAAIIMLIMTLTMHSLIERIPVHSCAVIIIVGAWQALNPKIISKSFSSFINLIAFIITVILCIFTGLISGIIFSAVYSIITYDKMSALSKAAGVRSTTD